MGRRGNGKDERSSMLDLREQRCEAHDQEADSYFWELVEEAWSEVSREAAQSKRDTTPVGCKVCGKKLDLIYQYVDLACEAVCIEDSEWFRKWFLYYQ